MVQASCWHLVPIALAVLALLLVAALRHEARMARAEAHMIGIKRDLVSQVCRRTAL